ncbi:armadillo repeat-containing protein 7 isoform X1 [Pieris rapae]|uniref:armadillo repeat-containing protein 7 isoform X1 n=1 Tax=Pieris rapae TaxID=64459 RepID=UPI000B92ACA8|nr:armadillo repeat-containing protein 7 isoform X1 [Pieris rapae]
MFTSLSYLKKHTPENGTDRESYLSVLVDEYLNSNSVDAKCQVLANLANFAYDPINFVFIRNVGVYDIFLYVIKNEANSQLLHFAAAGICNLCSDPLNVEYLMKHDGVKPLEKLLTSTQSETVADVITTFIQIYNNTSICNSSQVIRQIEILKTSENKIISNLAHIFLETQKKS